MIYSEKFKVIFNYLLIFLLVLLIFSLSSGVRDFELYGIKINIRYSNVLRLIAALLLIREILFKSGLWIYNVIKRTISPLIKGLSEKTSRFFTGGLCFLVFGIILGIYDSLSDSYTLTISGYTTLSPGWDTRLIRILSLLIYYSLPSFILGSSIIWLLSLKLQKEKLINITFYFAFVSFAFLSNSTIYSPMNLEPYGPFPVIDIIVYIVLSCGLMCFIPKFVATRSYSGLAVALAAVLIICSGYFTASVFEKKRMDKEASKPHRRVLLITMDTAREDHVSGIYSGEKRISPNLNEIAGEGVAFKRAYAEMPTTDSSHTSIMTGSYPRTHGLLKNGNKVSNPNISYLETWFQKRGFVTAAITSRVYLVPEELGWQSFDYEHYPLLNMLKRNYINTLINSRFVGEYAFQRAKWWLDRNYEKDFFLWVHFWDPHWPYSPPKPYDSKFNSGFKGYIKKGSSFIPENKKYTSEKIAYITSLYDGELAYTDEYVSRLVRYLESKIPSSSEPPLIIITADHGEALGELQERLNFVFGHEKTLHSGQMHIPLIIKWKGKLYSGRLFDELVESVDIAPTIVELLGEKGSFKCDGTSFAPLMRGEQYMTKEAVFGERRQYVKNKRAFLNVPEYSVTTKEWSLIINEIRGLELYDAINDRLEQNNVADEHSDIIKQLLIKLDEWKNKHKPAEPKQEIIMSDEKTKVLKSLGYVQ